MCMYVYVCVCAFICTCVCAFLSRYDFANGAVRAEKMERERRALEEREREREKEREREREAKRGPSKNIPPPLANLTNGKCSSN